MAKMTIVARLVATDGGTLNWAVLTSGVKPNTKVHTMKGDERRRFFGFWVRGQCFSCYVVEINPDRKG
jgi:hypothetical protein